MPYVVWELWLSMNTIPFWIKSEWTSVPIHCISMYAAQCPTHSYPTNVPVHTVTHINTETDIYTDISLNTQPG